MQHKIEIKEQPRLVENLGKNFLGGKRREWTRVLSLHQPLDLGFLGPLNGSQKSKFVVDRKALQRFFCVQPFVGSKTNGPEITNHQNRILSYDNFHWESIDRRFVHKRKNNEDEENFDYIEVLLHKDGNFFNIITSAFSKDGQFLKTKREEDNAERVRVEQKSNDNYIVIHI